MVTLLSQNVTSIDIIRQMDINTHLTLFKEVILWPC